MIRTCDLRYTYNGKDFALNGLDLHIQAGSFVAVIGANASGKSTFARHCNALLLPSGGKLFVLDWDSSDPAAAAEIRQKVGLVFQNPDNQMLGGLVEEDVAFGLCNLGVPSEEIESRVREALRVVGMEGYMSMSTHRLSGGQKQRVALAGIFAMRPSCIVLDEATAMLDPAGRRDVLAAVRSSQAAYPLTVILITHHVDEAAQADRVLVFAEGKVVLDGCPADVFAQADSLYAYGLTVPTLERLRRKLIQAGFSLPDRQMGLPEWEETIWQLWTEKSSC